MSYNRRIVGDDDKVIFSEENPATIKQSETIGLGSVHGALTLVEQTATPVRIGEANLEERHTVLIINANATDIFIGFADDVSGSNGIPVFGGTERAFSLNRTENFDLYAYSATVATVKIVEVK
jgi:hypothetical protein